MKALPPPAGSWLLAAALLVAAGPLRAQSMRYPDYNPATGELLAEAAGPEVRCFVVNDYAALTPAAPASPDQALLHELQPLLDGWNQAVLTRDQAWFAKYLADDYIRTSAGGEVTDKAHEIAEMRAPAAPHFARLERVPRPCDRVRFFNATTAVATSQLRTTSTDHGHQFSGQVRTLSTWVKRNGTWQAVAFQATPVVEHSEK